MPLFSNGDDAEHQQNGQNGAKKHDNRSPAGRSQRHDEDAPADERTRLLPDREDSDRHLLEPDDPAVSPYNLASIRALRYLTLLFTLLNVVWWITLLVSTFATPPGFHSRGSGFYAFSFSSLALADLLSTLIFFTVPSKAVRILAVVQGLVLLIDMIVLLAVDQLRAEEGWVGIVSIVWVVFVSGWTLLADTTVKWGKAEEEERLTGRAETRRTLTEWLEVLVSVFTFSVMLVGAVLLTMNIVLRGLDASLAPPGNLYWVDNNKYQIHVYCHGEKTDANGTELPTVLFEAGERPFEGELWEFADAAVANGSISRYCFADRPGFAWSDTAPSPLSVGFAVDALAEALLAADEQGPFILASAGIGSIYSRVFSARNSDQVQGFVLIDPMHEDYLEEVASSKRGFILWLRGVISPLGLDRLPGAIFRRRTSQDRIYGISAHQTGKYIFAKLQEGLVASSFSRRDIDTSRYLQRPKVPLVVISSGEKIKESAKWEMKQRDLTRITEKLLSWDIVDKAPHEVWRTLEGRRRIEKRLKQMVHEKRS